MPPKHNYKKVIKLSETKKKGKQVRKDNRMIAIAILIAVVIGLLLGFKPNAYEVTIGGKAIGAIKDKKIVAQAKESVIAQLKSSYGTEVKFEEEPILRRYRAKKSDYISASYLVTYMRQNMAVVISFREVQVEGVPIGVVPLDKDVEELKQKLKEAYYGKKDVEVAFGKKVEAIPVFEKEANLIKIDKLVEKCLVTTPKEVSYEVKSGDTLWGISTGLGVSLEALKAENPGLEDNSVLKIGQVFKAKVHEPLLPLTIIKDNTVKK